MAPFDSIHSIKLSDSCGTVDTDGDGVFDLCDNCVQAVNPGQEDEEGDGYGDSCDVCIIVVSGDTNFNGVVNSADLIDLVHVVFKSNPNRAGPCLANADVNCSGAVTSGDIIYLVNHVFKSGPPPCDICFIVPALWSCDGN